MRKPILVLDFDGVIHSYSSGWRGATVIPDPPVPGAMQFIWDALNAGWDVCILSSRSHKWGGRRAMRRWLREHAGDLWREDFGTIGLEDVRFPLFKPPALVTIDDRALTFTGEWPALDVLKAFQPWNKSPKVSADFIARRAWGDAEAAREYSDPYYKAQSFPSGAKDSPR